MSTTRDAPTREILLRLLRDCGPARGSLAWAAIAIVGLGATQLAITWLLKRWIEGPFVSGDRAALRLLLIEGLALSAIGAVCLFFSRVLVTAANQVLVASLRDRALANVLRLNLTARRRLPSGDIMARVLSDAGALSTFLGSIVRRALREGMVVAGAVTLLIVLDWRLALMLGALVPPAAWLIARFGRTIRARGREAQQDVGALGAVLDEQLQGWTTIKGLRSEARERHRFALGNESYRRKVMRGEVASAALLSVVFVLTAAGLAAIVWFGSRLLTSGAMTPGALLAFCLYAGQIIEPIRRLGELQGLLQQALASAARVYELIDLPDRERAAGIHLSPALSPALPLVGTAAAAAEAGRRVRVDRVTFGYDGRDVLRDLSFELRAGEQVALVGASGAGKSTLAWLLAGFHVPRVGHVFVDDVDTAAADLASLRAAVVAVEQEPYLFSGPIADSVRYARPDATDDEVRAAVELCGLAPVVARLPDDLRTPLAEAGKQLSGGERQRLALARAVIADPGVLILDEATAALDGEREADVFARLAPWLARRTVIAISHRLATVNRFPRVLLLHEGRIVADGAPAALAREQAQFSTLFAGQISSAAIEAATCVTTSAARR